MCDILSNIADMSGQALHSASSVASNPLLRTLFRTGDLATVATPPARLHPLAQIGLQSAAPGALQRELLAKQSQIDSLLNQNNEKERLLIEALRQQGKGIFQTSSTSTTVPTFIPAVTTSTTTTTTTEASNSDVENFNEENRNLSDGEFEELDDSDFEVEIILEMTRELVEARRNATPAPQEPLDTQQTTAAPVPASVAPFEAIMNARAAVIRTMEARGYNYFLSIYLLLDISS